MDHHTKNLIEELKKGIQRWEDEVRFWEDPRIIGLEDIGGSRMSGQQVADGLRRRIAEWRALIRRIEETSS